MLDPSSDLIPWFFNRSTDASTLFPRKLNVRDGLGPILRLGGLRPIGHERKRSELARTAQPLWKCMHANFLNYWRTVVDLLQI